MTRIFRSPTPGRADYLSLAVFALALVGVMVFVVAPKGTFSSAEPVALHRTGF